MGYKTDKVAPSPGLLGEWRYQTLTIGGKVAIALVAIVCLSTVSIFGIGVVLGLWSAIFFLVFFGQRTYRCVRVYPDRIEAISVWVTVQERRIEASKIEAVSSVLSLAGKERYGNVLVTGSGGSKMILPVVQNPIGLVNKIREISSAPAAKVVATPNVPNQGETRTCPFCAEEVKIEAIKCKHCGSDIA